jgi:hypothetical protein
VTGFELAVGAAILWAAYRGVREAAASVRDSYRDRRERWWARAASWRGWTARDAMAPTVSIRAVRFGVIAGAAAGTTAIAAYLAGRGFGRGARAGWHLGWTWGRARLRRRRYGVEPGEADEATEVVDAELVTDAQDADAEDTPPQPRGPVAELGDRPAVPPHDVSATRPGDPSSHQGEDMAEQMQSEVVTYESHVRNLTVLQGEARAEGEAAELAKEAAASAKNRAISDAGHAEQIAAGLVAADFGARHVANMAQIQELLAAQVKAASALERAAWELMEGADAIENTAEQARWEFEAEHRGLAEAHAEAAHAAKREGYAAQ